MQSRTAYICLLIGLTSALGPVTYQVTSAFCSQLSPGSSLAPNAALPYSPAVCSQQWAAPIRDPKGVLSSTSFVKDVPFERINFTFTYYGLEMSAVYVSVNGFVTLTPQPLCDRFCDVRNADLNQLAVWLYPKFYKIFPNGLGGHFPLIGAYVEALDARQGGEVRHLLHSYDGQNSLTVEWYNVTQVDVMGANKVSFQLQLLGNGTFFFRYKEVIQDDTAKAQAFSGLVWSTYQRLRIPENAIQSGWTIRLEPVADPCSGHNTCEACSAVGNDQCFWCGSNNLCIQRPPKTSRVMNYQGEWCAESEQFTNKCKQPLGPYYSQHFEYFDINGPNLISGEYVDMNVPKRISGSTEYNCTTAYAIVNGIESTIVALGSVSSDLDPIDWCRLHCLKGLPTCTGFAYQVESKMCEFYTADIHKGQWMPSPSLTGFHVCARMPGERIGVVSRASFADDVVSPSKYPDRGFAYDLIQHPDQNFSFPWFYNPPAGAFQNNSSLPKGQIVQTKDFYINPNGFISLDGLYPQCINGGFCSDVSKYSNVIGPFLVDLFPVDIVEALITYAFTSNSVIVEWNQIPRYHSVQDAALHNESYSFQVELYSSGNITMRYFGAYDHGPGIDTGSVWWPSSSSAFIGILRDSSSRSLVSWTQIRTGLALTFQPVPGCVADCSGKGVCNSTDQTCICISHTTGEYCDGCEKNYYGPTCSQRCLTCQNGGYCNDGLEGDGKCVCPDGWSGKNCEYKCECKDGVCPTCEDYCWNGGYCLCGDCQCTEEWQGKTCLIHKTSNFHLVTTLVFISCVPMGVCILVVGIYCLRRTYIRRQRSVWVLERTSAGERQLVPVHRIPVQANPVQGIPLQTLPIEDTMFSNEEDDGTLVWPESGAPPLQAVAVRSLQPQHPTRTIRRQRNEEIDGETSIEMSSTVRPERSSDPGLISEPDSYLANSVAHRMDSASVLALSQRMDSVSMAALSHRNHHAPSPSTSFVSRMAGLQEMASDQERASSIQE